RRSRGGVVDGPMGRLGVARIFARALLAVLFSAASARGRAPARLSADHGRAKVESDYGSGHFGSWFVDGFGLPAFRYELDEEHDPRAQQPELAGGTAAQHQVGNDNIV